MVRYVLPEHEKEILTSTFFPISEIGSMNQYLIHISALPDVEKIFCWTWNDQ